MGTQRCVRTWHPLSRRRFVGSIPTPGADPEGGSLGLAAQRLLRRHVGYGAPHHARHGDPGAVYRHGPSRSRPAWPCGPLSARCSPASGRGE